MFVDERTGGKTMSIPYDPDLKRGNDTSGPPPGAFTPKLSAPLTEAVYYDAKGNPLPVVQTEPFSATMLSLPITFAGVDPLMAKELIKRYNNYLPWKALVQNVARHQPGTMGNWAQFLLLQAGETW